MDEMKIGRRDFVKYSLTALLAMNFGCSIKNLLESDKKATAIIYGTKYGATRDTALWIRNGMDGNADALDIVNLDFKSTISRYDHFIVGSGVWIDGIHKKIKEFLAAESGNLRDRVLASFVVCGTQDTTAGGRRRIKRYIKQFHTPLGYEPPLSSSFGGRVIVEQLTEDDREALTKFYRKYLKKEIESWDRTDPSKALQYGKDLALLVDKYTLKI